MPALIQIKVRRGLRRTSYTSEKCLACGGVHLVNSLSGKLMSEERPRPRPDPG